MSSEIETTIVTNNDTNVECECGNDATYIMQTVANGGQCDSGLCTGCAAEEAERLGYTLPELPPHQ
jgi:hypothetical protein